MGAWLGDFYFKDRFQGFLPSVVRVAGNWYDWFLILCNGNPANNDGLGYSEFLLQEEFRYEANEAVSFGVQTQVLEYYLNYLFGFEAATGYRLLVINRDGVFPLIFHRATEPYLPIMHYEAADAESAPIYYTREELAGVARVRVVLLQNWTSWMGADTADRVQVEMNKRRVAGVRMELVRDADETAWSAYLTEWYNQNNLD